MAKQFNITTTGTKSVVGFPDLGKEPGYTHPITVDLYTEFTSSEISESLDVQLAIASGWVTVKNETGNSIVDSTSVSNGDMYKSTYDTTSSGTVDNSDKLGGKTGQFYLDADNQTEGLLNKLYTSSEKQKLASLESSKFLGEYPSLQLLKTAHPTPVAGSYGNIDTGVGGDVERYVWDATDSKYILQLGKSTALTDAQIKSQYESNPDTNSYSDSEKSKLAGIEQGAKKDQTDLTLPTSNTGTSLAGSNQRETNTEIAVRLDSLQSNKEEKHTKPTPITYLFSSKGRDYTEFKTRGYMRVAVVSVKSTAVLKPTSIQMIIYGQKSKSLPISVKVITGNNIIVEKTGINSLDDLNSVYLGALSNVPTQESIWEFFVKSNKNKEKVRVSSLKIE